MLQQEVAYAGTAVDIDAIAPGKTSDQVQLQEQEEDIEILWEAFLDNLNAFRTGMMKHEVNYTLFNAPGPAQYAAFNALFEILEDAETQLWDLKRYMYTHDFAAIDDKTKPAILGLLQNLISAYASEQTKITMVSGSFWKNHIPTRLDIISLFEKLFEKNSKLRIVTMAKRDESYIGDLVSLLGRDSKFGLTKRIPIHFVQAGPDFLFFEFPHTESTMFRLNMLVDLNTLRYKPGKTKADLLKFLDRLIKRGL